MRILCLSLFLILAGCQSSDVEVAKPKTVERKPSVIYVGMPFELAEAKLKEYGAVSTGREVLLSRKSAEKGFDLHFYKLRSGTNMDLVSKLGKTGRIVANISVSTYRPKSWDSKQDPEYDKFTRSFKAVADYDLGL